MYEPNLPPDPRAMNEEDLAEVPDPPSPADPDPGPAPAAEDEKGTSDPDGAHREAPAGEDYAGSGF